MKKPKLLDLFCGAGGAAMGYHRAGFEVVGVDIKPQPHYPFEFYQADALVCLNVLLSGEPIKIESMLLNCKVINDAQGHNLYLKDIAAIHASPPCQKFSVMTNGRWQDRVPNHPDLIKPIRQLLIATGKPYVIENVPGAKKELINPIMLCGTSFGLGTKDGNQLRRHRYFELSFPFNSFLPQCQHNKASAIGVYGGGQNPARRKPVTIGVWGHAGGSSKRDGLIQFGSDARREAMGIDWMTGNELSEAIPPAYTEYIGKYLLGVVRD